MTKFKEWCSGTDQTLGKHKLTNIAVKPLRRNHGIKVLAEALPGYYIASDRVADLLSKLSRPKVAVQIRGLIPTMPKIRSGDLGEVLGLAYASELSEFEHSVKRLRWKDHRNMAMRGEDVLAFAAPQPGKRLGILKGEVKSRVGMTTRVIADARKALCSNGGLPSPHAVSFLATRLFETGKKALCDIVDLAQVERGIVASQVSHLLFSFSGNDAKKMLEASLIGYAGPVRQLYVGLNVVNHKEFVTAVFEAKVGVK
jgi:hypothetical protein